MSPIRLQTPISELTRVGKVTSSRLAKLGVATIRDLLLHFPARYEDYSRMLRIRELRGGETGSIAGTLTSLKKRQTAYKKMNLTEAYLDDGTGTLKLIWFNQPFLAETLKEGENIIVAGTVERDWRECLFKNPSFEKYQNAKTLHTGRLVPVYPATYGLTQKQIRFLVSQALKAAGEFRNIIPDAIRKRERLGNKANAIRAIHLPASTAEYQEARRHLLFEELFLTGLLVERSRQQLARAEAPAIPFHKEATQELVRSLPFRLTDDQRRAAWDILRDMEKSRPANRLLQGEVGSGKTVVAAIAALNAALGGFQTAFMAPTEILALQHFQTISTVFPDKSVAVLTSKHARISTNGQLTVPTQRNEIKKAIAEGAISITIGTHAIIQTDVSFNKLGLIIIDEQHRFGVEQRKKLKDKTAGDVPHFLSMTATPIPRSLALTLYGDLDISTIRELPKERKRVHTRIVPERGRAEAYQFAAGRIAAGEQVFVVCPLIEESDSLGVSAATSEFEKLRKGPFALCRVGLIHGKLKSAEKERVMNDFKTGSLDVLVATAVVEVGVDVPNATVMVIEGAERFGFSQLHQFRGRVGRSQKQSYCLLFAERAGAETRKRLEAFTAAADGFEIAELDLAHRGPGDLYGTTQSGYLFSALGGSAFGGKIAKLTDTALAAQARNHAQNLLREDAKLGAYSELAYELAKYEHELHFE
ncbi:MAG: ATP-dependent DNA helicase RecG [Parcubacteria group bacterium]|nr:ATP-dependent DNA helicase RecG [Parcubacteria group bacterium]